MFFEGGLKSLKTENGDLEKFSGNVTWDKEGSGWEVSENFPFVEKE